MRAWSICKRELGAYFQTPTAYVVLAVYLILSGYMFASYAILAREAEMRTVLGNMAVVFLFIAPALTTRLWAEERRSGTDELLLTAPVSTAQVVLGKYLAALGLFAAFLALTGLFPGLMEAYGDLDWPATLTGYLGLALLGGAALAAGLFASSLTDSQAVAAVTGFGILLMFWLAGWIGDSLPGTAGKVLQYAALTRHYQDFAKGVIDLGDVLYLLSLATAFLFLAVRRLEAARVRAHTAVWTAAVLTLLAVANALAARHPVRWDLTRDRAFSLSAATREVLGRLREPVQVIGFYENGDAGRMADLMKEYAAASGGMVAFTAVDPVARPSLVQQYQVADFGTLVLEQGNRREKVDPWDTMGEPDPTGQGGFAGELAVTRALVRLTQDRPRTVYFLQGHGERDLQGDFSQARRALEAEGYQVRPLNLVTEAGIPADADAIVIAGPRRDLTEQEAERLAAWARTGKGLIGLVDPLPGSGPPLANLERLLRLWGVALGNDVVVDPARNYLRDQAAPVPEYAHHAITGKLDAGALAMVIPGPRSLRQVEAAGALESPLLRTSDKAWAAPAGAVPAGGSLKQAPGSPRGPFTLGVAVEFPESRPASAEAAAPSGAGTAAPDAAPRPAPVPGKGVFVGSSAFATNDLIRIQGNLDFLVNAVNWVTSRPDGLSIRPKPAIRRDLTLTGRDVSLIFWSSVAGLPLLVLAAGGAVWWRRRHL